MPGYQSRPVSYGSSSVPVVPLAAPMTVTQPVVAPMTVTQPVVAQPVPQPTGKWVYVPDQV